MPLLSRDTSPDDTWLARTPGGPLTVSLLEGSDDIDVYLLLGEDGATRNQCSPMGSGAGVRYRRTESRSPTGATGPAHPA